MRRLLVFVTLLLLVTSIILLNVSDASISAADTSITDNEVATKEGDNSSASVPDKSGNYKNAEAKGLQDAQQRTKNQN